VGEGTGSSARGLRGSNRELRFAGAAKVRGIRLVGDRVLLRRARQAPPSAGDLWTPATETRQAWICTVLAVGPDVASEAHSVRPGDTVAVPARAGGGLVLRIDGEDHVIVRARDILAVVAAP
jgi:co-chaperonin GroES (HSP10)